MLDQIAMIGAACVAASAGIGAAVPRVSPTVGRRTRALFAGVAPMAVVIGAEVAQHDSVTLYGAQIAAVLAAIGLGVLAAGKTARLTASDDAALLR